ncbi:transglycosylase SLT domain-containing protein [Streptomyces sp. DSM 44915]|uniref:Transglycosylase SLT domain-containing protein n=1 Tax=Streptomyces chisholmiae TaxID=3075540 RepID=A0ABU2JLU9_9ACTN|nr:transglycosylase SLT domain-containing protein [Streptomyces sp. DSM 44915]MDT0265940.1 transglycosylase SLT domain-containing protein [Streptomyces sp. DSM 44915]
MAGVVAAGAAAMAVSLVPGNAAADSARTSTAPAPTATGTDAPVAFTLTEGQTAASLHETLEGRPTALDLRPFLHPTQIPAAEDEAEADATETADTTVAAEDAGTDEQPAEEAPAADEAAAEATEESTEPAAVEYPDNLDGWIREALAIMDEHGIPGSYEGIHRNIMRESSGDPYAINLWDINAQNGVPSKGLLQVIEPTFAAYHVEGTAYDQYDPVANIVAACNYAADRYGSMDNVNGPY